MSKHLVIAGHGMQRNGRFDSGATGIIRKGEHKYVVEDLFPAMRRHLPKNHNVVFFSKHKVSNYGDLVSLVRQYNATQVTEIHYDAATSAARRGHVIIHSDYSPDKIDLSLRDAINNMVGVRYTHNGYNGISGRSNLFNVNLARRNNISYRLIELGFGTNPQDANIMVNQVDEYAKELVKAITGEVSESPTVTEKVESKSSTNKVESAVKNDYVGRRLESKINNLRFYNKPSWSDKNLVGRVNKGIGFPTIVRKLKVGKGEQYEVKNSKGQSYYVTASNKYVSVVGAAKPKKKSTPSYVGKRVESKINNLRFYSKPSWSDSDVVGRVNKGIGFPTIVRKLEVGKGEQYEVKNSKGSTFYITASNKYVTVK